MKSIVSYPDDVQLSRMSRAAHPFVTACVGYHGHGGWEGLIPSWLLTELPKARLTYLNAGGDPNLVCELDVVPYLTLAPHCVRCSAGVTASFEGPLGSEWAHIFLHVAFKMLRVHGAGFVSLPSDEDAMACQLKPRPKRGIQGHAIVAREADRSLSQYEDLLLTKLRGDLRASQVRHAHKAGRTNIPKERNHARKLTGRV